MNPWKILFLTTLLLTVACSHIDGNSVRLDSGYRVTSTKSAPATTKIFLIAGSRDSANFAQEIVDQKNFWLSQGYKNEQIACYYVPPPTQSDSDQKQFKALLAATRDCFLADPRIIYRHIREAGKYNLDSMYVYVTSHGSTPYAQRNFTYNNAADKKAFEDILALPQWGNTYLMEMEGMWHEGILVGMYNVPYRMQTYAPANPHNADDYLFTPRGLRKALSFHSPGTKKVVVLQGCHTGGFILPAKSVGEENTLEGLSNTTVLTAASSDRTSFGCDVGSHTTYFGMSFQNSLKKYAVGKTVNQVDWKQVYRTTLSDVTRRELKMGQGKKTTSKPQYYLN